MKKTLFALPPAALSLPLPAKSRKPLKPPRPSQPGRLPERPRTRPLWQKWPAKPRPRLRGGRREERWTRLYLARRAGTCFS